MSMWRFATFCSCLSYFLLRRILSWISPISMHSSPFSRRENDHMDHLRSSITGLYKYRFLITVMCVVKLFVLFKNVCQTRFPVVMREGRMREWCLRMGVWSFFFLLWLFSTSFYHYLSVYIFLHSVTSVLETNWQYWAGCRRIYVFMYAFFS